MNEKCLGLEEILELCKKVKSWKSAKHDHYMNEGWDVMGDKAIIREGNKYSFIGSIQGYQIDVFYDDNFYFLHIATPQSREGYGVKVTSPDGMVLGEYEDYSKKGRIRNVYESLKYFGQLPSKIKDEQKEAKAHEKPETPRDLALKKARKIISED